MEKNSEHEVCRIIKEACALEEEVSLESVLSLLSLDSLSFINVLVEIEETFEIEFDIEELGIFNWKTVGDIVKVVEEHRCNKM